MVPWHMLACSLTLLAPAVAYPNHIGCDFKVIAGKVSAGLNVMTTSGNIMGQAPKTAPTLGATTSTTFTAGSNVTFDFGSTPFPKGFAHATAGKFTAPDFTATSTGAACVGTNTMVTRATGSANQIIWTAPADVSALASVTFSFAASAGYTDGVHRKSVVLKNQAQTTTTTTKMATTTTKMSTAAAAASGGSTTSGSTTGTRTSGAFAAMLATVAVVM